MANKYENVEKLTDRAKKLDVLKQNISSTEKKLSDILKKISEIEADYAAKEAARANAEAEKAKEEAAKAALEASKKSSTINTSTEENIISETPKEEVKKVEKNNSNKQDAQKTSEKSVEKTDVTKENPNKNDSGELASKKESNTQSDLDQNKAESKKEVPLKEDEKKQSSKVEEKANDNSVADNKPLDKQKKEEVKKSESTNKVSDSLKAPEKSEEKKVEKAVTKDPVVSHTSNPTATNNKTPNNNVQNNNATKQPFNPNAPRPAGAKRPPMRFVNGQAVGVYVAKPGVESGNNNSNNSNNSNSYRSRQNGDKPYQARQNGDKPYQARQNGDKSYQPRQNGDKPYQQRTNTQKPRASVAPITIDAPIIQKETKQFSSASKKKTFEKTYVEKKPVSKRALIKQQGMTVEDFDESKSGYRKLRTPKKQKQQEIQTVKIDHAVVASLEIPLKVLSEKLGISAVEISKRLFKQGIMKSINDSIDYDNAALLALDMGIDLEYKPEKTAEDVLHDVETEQDPSKLVTRAPVVTVMGHVDHGKTSLLDKIRSTSVTSGEAGGITQSIGAYSVVAKGKQITFIDTPGHAAFSAMRARGARVTDIVVLVVAADDGIMPQTIEAINHAKAADVPIIVAMNKMDKHDINPDKVKQQLLEQGLVSEEWGGDTMIVPVSAKTGMGIDELLESISLVAEMQELKADPDRPAKGTIIEAKLDKGKGPVASIIVENGTLHTGDNILSGTTMGRVRAMFDDKGKIVKSAGPSMAVSVLGFEDVPHAGDSLMAVDQALMKQVQEERKNKEREGMIKEQSRVTLDDVFAQVEEGKMKNLNLIVKGDVQGSVEAVKQSLEKLSNEEVRVKVIHAAAGAINESDIMLAESANAIIIGFNVRPDTKAKKLAETSKVDVRSYRIIYELLDDIEKALKGMLAPKIKEILSGKCEVRQTFNITGAGTIAGCYVLDGKIVRGGKLRIYRDDIMICEGGVKQLKRFKDDVKEVAYGFECGCAIEGFNEIRVGDIIECYITEEIKA